MGRIPDIDFVGITAQTTKTETTETGAENMRDTAGTVRLELMAETALEASPSVIPEDETNPPLT